MASDEFSNDMPISAFPSHTLASFRVLFFVSPLYFMVDMADLKERWVESYSTMSWYSFLYLFYTHMISIYLPIHLKMDIDVCLPVKYPSKMPFYSAAYSASLC